MRRRPEDFAVYAIAAIILAVVFSISIALLSQPSPAEINQKNISSTLPTPLPTSGESSVVYEPSAGDRVAKKINKDTRTPLAPSDELIKKRLISSTSSILYESPLVRVVYAQDSDIFQAEILSTNIVRAKSVAHDWLRLQGMSQQGICNLPLIFNVNYEIEKQLSGSNQVIDPLPEGC